MNHLPSTVIGNEKHTHLYAAYLYYYVATSVPLRQLLVWRGTAPTGALALLLLLRR
jgi:hypothetical protein